MTTAGEGVLAPLEVHVLSFDLSDDTPLDVSSLDQGERERGARFRRPIDSRRWIRSRAALRAALGSVLGRAPSSLRFEQDAYGKPRLTGVDGERLSFNLSHSADVAVVAIAEVAASSEQAPMIGVDVERVVPVPELTAIARHHFSPEEQEALQLASPDDRTTAFFAIWTRKEAFVKALGLGIGAPLERFAVSVRPDESSLRRVDPVFGALAEWRVWGWQPRAGYVGALAVRTPARTPMVRFHGAALPTLANERSGVTPLGGGRPDLGGCGRLFASTN